ncbi:MAG: YggT family protein [bacterium]|nr:YggT family protein [bacterium]
MAHQLYFIADKIFQLLYIALMIRIVLSWIPHNPYNPLIEFIYKITAPILDPFRSLIPPIGGFDLTPIFAFIAIGVVKNIVFMLIRLFFTG